MRKASEIIPNDSVVIVRHKHHRKMPMQGEVWQPEVAQFLLDMYPHALEQGVPLSDIFSMAVDNGRIDLTEPEEYSAASEEDGDGEED